MIGALWLWFGGKSYFLDDVDVPLVFGDLFQKLKITQENLVLIQEQLSQNPRDPFLLDKDFNLNMELKLLLD